MPNSHPITIIDPPSIVSLTAEIDSSGELVLSAQGTTLDDDNDHGLVIRYARPSRLPVRVEVIDFGPTSSPWTMSAVHEQTTWQRSSDRCTFDWDEPITETQVEVRATRSGVTKSEIIFIKVEPQGTKPAP